MKLTIGIISCNRFKYLKSLIQSISVLKKQDNNIEIIVADNSSLERGLRDYLEQMLTDKIIDNLKINLDYDSTNGEYIARNIIIKESTKENILIIDEEYQFIGTYELLRKYVEDFTNSDYIAMDIFGKRNSTIFEKINYNKCVSTQNKCKYWVMKDTYFLELGLFKKWVFQEIGEYPVADKNQLWSFNDNSNVRQKEYYNLMVIEKIVKSKIGKVKDTCILAHIPLFVSVWNDPRGCNSFIKDNKRYGHYLDPPNNKQYYDYLSDDEIKCFMDYKFPISFTLVAKPIDWEYAKTEMNEQKKYDKKNIILEGPISDLIL